MTPWTFHVPGMTIEDLGYLPDMLSEHDPRPAREQYETAYGWHPMKGFKLLARDRLYYPGDPVKDTLASTKLRSERILFYDGAWVAIIQPDGSFEVSRMD